MNAKRACLVALVMTLAGVGAARAQYGTGPSGGAGSPPPAAFPAPGPEPGPADAPVPPPTGPRLSDYILGTRPDCCGPIGGNGPIGTELYVRWGPSINTAAGYFGRTLETGWEVQAGGRVLFFNPAADAAWVVDLGVSDVANHGQHSDKVALLHFIIVPDPMTGAGTRVPAVQVTPTRLNRTYVNVGFGRECYLWGSAAQCACGKVEDAVNWRAGLDVGGRYGTEKLELHEIRHRTDTIAAVYLALHTDLEIPWHGVIFQVGGRVEWDYTWMDILQDTPADLQNVNILMTLGVRY